MTVSASLTSIQGWIKEIEANEAVIKYCCAQLTPGLNEQTRQHCMYMICTLGQRNRSLASNISMEAGEMRGFWHESGHLQRHFPQADSVDVANRLS